MNNCKIYFSLYKKVKSFLITSVLFVLSFNIFSETQQNKKIVRIGHENVQGFIEDIDGNHTGYGVEFLEAVCKKTNWQIEYVCASWEQQILMLQNGQIDFMPFAQQTEERKKIFDFTKQPMGSIQGLLSAHTNDICYEEYSAFDGKLIGMIKKNVNSQYLEQYAKAHNFSYKLVEFEFQAEALEALQQGKIELIATEQVVGCNDAHVVAHFISDATYFMCKKNNPLLKELDLAIAEIYSHDVTFSSDLYKKYYKDKIVNSKPTFSRQEMEFINKNQEIPVMFIPDTQPNVYFDDKGNVTGIIPDYLKMVSELSGLKFGFNFGSTGESSFEYLKQNDNFLLGDVILTNPELKDMNLLCSKRFYTNYAALLLNTKSAANFDLQKSKYKIAVLPTFPVFHFYINNNYPNFELDKSYNTISDAMQALNDNKVDGFVYDLNMVLHYWGSPRYKNTRIVSTSFFEEPQCFAMKNTEENQILISIIDKCIDSILESKVLEFERYHVAKNYYKPTIGDTIYKLRMPLLLGALLVLTIYLFLSSSAAKNKNHADWMLKKNNELAEAVKKAEQASKAKTEFLSLMSHDIRTPMNAIMGMTKLAQNEKTENQKIYEYLSKIQKSSEVLLRLLNDILDKSAIEVGKLKINAAPFDLKEDLSVLYDIYKPQCDSKQIQFIIDSSQVSNFYLIGDVMRLNQILLNLISNAFKFTENGGTISVKICQIESIEQNTKLQIFVSDTGCGMDQNMLSRLFLAFEQKDATTAHKYGGSGLGLNITKNLTELMGGNIDVKSIVGKGTTFIVTIPFKIDALKKEQKDFDNSTKEKSLNKNSTLITEQFDFSDKLILVADDDYFNREVVSGLLDLVKAKCDCVDDGQKVIDKFINSTSNEYDAILLDVHMPVVNGYDAAKKIRQSAHPDAKTIPILALTADAFPDDIEKAKQSGMNVHIAKPIYQEVLYNTLEEIFNFERVE